MATLNSIDSNIPIEISKGGTNNTSFGAATTIIYDGTKLTGVGPGTSSYVLTSNGAGVAPSYQPASASAVITIDADSGSASPSAGIVTWAGGTNTNTSASGSTVTVNLNNSVSTSGSLTTGTTMTVGTGLTVTTGGTSSTGTTTLSSLGAGVMQTNSSGVVSSTKGTDGQILISSTAGSPAWATITAGSNITVTNASNSITIASSGGGNGSATSSGSWYATTTQNNVTGDGTVYTLIFDTKVFDQGSNWDGTSTFTAPQTGKYLFIANVLMNNIVGGNGHTEGKISIAYGGPGTTGRNYSYELGSVQDIRDTNSGSNTLTFSITVIENLTANDTVTFTVEVAGSSKEINVSTGQNSSIFWTLLA